MSLPGDRTPWRRWWSVFGLILGLGGLLWILGRVDYGRMREVAAHAALAPLLMVPPAIAAEQLVRAWKWRQLLLDLRPVGSLRLFGAVMAGYFVTMIIPLGISPLVRSWLVARLEDLRMSAVLATAAIERLVDGLVFTVFVALALAWATVPDSAGAVRTGLLLGGGGGLLGFSLVLYGLARFKARAPDPGAWPARLAGLLPARAAGPALRVVRSFAEGIVWPRRPWRGAAIVLASVTMKLIALTHFYWAGLGFGVVLGAADYVFLLVFLGFLVILSRLTRVPGGFFLGAIFALELLGVAEEQALAMVLVVEAATVLTIASCGALALWRNGIAIGDLKAATRAAESA